MSDAFHVLCPDCDRVNRIPRDRPAQAAQCGHCGAKLFRGKPIELSGERFRRHLARTDIPVVADFWAAWCGPCRAMAPVFERAAQALEPRARLVRVDVDAEPQLAAEFGVQGIPALFLFKNGAGCGPACRNDGCSFALPLGRAGGPSDVGIRPIYLISNMARSISRRLWHYSILSAKIGEGSLFPLQ